MTKKETAKILAILQAGYPDSFRDKTDEAIKVVVELWASVFADDSFESVSAALLAHIATDNNRYMPPPGIIKNMLIKINSPAEMTEAEAWSYVSKALRNSTYGAEKEFDKLPESVKSVVRSPSQLREWAVLPIDELQTVVASNFQRSFRARAASDREFKALPEKVRVMMLTNIKSLKGGTENA